MAKNKASSKKVSAKPGIPRATGLNSIVSPPKMAHISDCADDYGRCLADPFTGPVACVPGQIPIQTLKTRFWNRGTFFIGTQGVGYIAIDPYNFSVNNVDSVTFTPAGFAGVDYSVAGASVARSNSSYTFAQIADAATGAQVRIVGIGIRIRYSGTELQRAGTVFSFHDPTHSSLIGASAATLGDEQQCKRFPVSRDWINLTYSPVRASDFELGTFVNIAFGASVNNLRWYMGHLVTGAQSGSSFDYEVYGVYEFNGINIRGMTTSHSDPVGLAAAVTVSQSAPPSVGSGEQRQASFISRMGSELTHGFSTALSLYQGGKAVVQTGQDIYSMYHGAPPSNFLENVKNVPAMIKFAK